VIRVVPGDPNPKPVAPPEKVPMGDCAAPVPLEGLPGARPAPEGRLDNLERQLKKVMDELESLRKEMKTQPRPGGGIKPGVEVRATPPSPWTRGKKPRRNPGPMPEPKPEPESGLRTR